MPIGDPMGGEGGPGRLDVRAMGARAPAADLDGAVALYHNLLGLKVIARGEGFVRLGGDGAVVELFAGKGEASVMMATPSIYDLHKELMDAGVEIVDKPLRDGELGLRMSFRDGGGNLVEVREGR